MKGCIDRGCYPKENSCFHCSFTGVPEKRRTDAIFPPLNCQRIIDICLWDHESIFAPCSAALVMSRRVVGRQPILYCASRIIGRAKEANHHSFSQMLFPGKTKSKN